jgi:hypothetical protein
MAIDPYIKKNPNDLIQSGDWNDIQVRARTEIRSHTHRGDADGTPIPREGIMPNAIDGTRIDPASRVTVAQLKVVDRDLLADINTLITRANDFDARINALANRANGADGRLNNLENRAGALETSRAARAGDTFTGAVNIAAGNFTVSGGAIVPRVGNAGDAGIYFPINPGGGGGDEAFIRYYVEAGETTKLLIGINNDVDDTLGLWQAGAERLTVRNGVVDVKTSLGIGTAQVNLPAKLSLGTEAANTKIALFDNPTDLYGFGIGGSQMRLHVGNAGARFSFLNSANGTEVFTVKGNGRVGINDVTPNEHLSLGGMGSCIELGANVADKEANAGKIVFRRWADALEIIGAGSNSQRRLKIWAEAGTEFTGAITPAVGNSPNAGIQFPINPAGGSGDEAFMRYFSVSGERMMLRIGINNDVDDALTLHQAGADRLTVRNGGVHLSGNIGTSGYDAYVGLPPNWGGGVHTFDIACRATGRAVHGWQTGGWDLAEKFDKHDPTLEPGDVVVADPSTPERLIRSSAPYERTLLGVISEKPGFLLGVAWEDPINPVALGLAGRVPVKVTLEGGPIHIGDPLTSSSTPGHAMRAMRSGRVIGVALEGFDGSQGKTGKVIVFLNPHWLEAR